MSDAFDRAAAPIWRDLATSHLPEPRIDREDWVEEPTCESVWICTEQARTGVIVDLELSHEQQVVEVSDRLHDWAVDELWGRAPTNWPRCPHHPSSHPLVVAPHEGVAWWSCPLLAAPVVRVGFLADLG